MELTQKHSMEMELSDYIRILWNRKWLIFIGCGLCVAAAYIASLLMSKRFDAPFVLGIGIVANISLEDSNSVTQIINSPAFESSVHQKANIPQDHPISVAATTDPVKQTPIVSVTASASTPQEAMTVANAAIALIQERHERFFNNKMNIYLQYEQSLQGQIQEVQNEIAQCRNSLNKLESSNQLAALVMQSQLADYDIRFIGLEREMRDLKVQNHSELHSRNTQVIAPPQQPNQPSRPRTKLNVAAAAIVGLFLSTFAALFLESTRRSKTDRE